MTDHDHSRTFQSDHPEPTSDAARIGLALRELLIETGRYTESEEQAVIAAMQGASPENGARIVARAWTDPAYKARLLENGAGAIRDLGFNLEPYEFTLVVQGKGNQERTAYLSGGARRAVDDWLAVRGREPGALFVRVGKDGRAGLAGLTAQALYEAVRKRAREAGLEEFSPHDLRRTFVGDLLDAGADVSLVQKLAGHSQVTTTTKYDRRPERAKQKASELLHVSNNPGRIGLKYSKQIVESALRLCPHR